MDRYTLVFFKWITNKDLLYTQGTLLNVMWQPGWEGSLGENGYMCMAESLCCSSETITMLTTSYTAIQNKKVKKKQTTRTY